MTYHVYRLPDGEHITSHNDPGWAKILANKFAAMSIRNGTAKTHYFVMHGPLNEPDSDYLYTTSEQHQGEEYYSA